MHGKGGGFILKGVAAFLVAFMIAAAGTAKIFSIRINAAASQEALMLSRLVKNEIRFKNAPYSVLVQTVKNENYKYIGFDGEKFVLDSRAGKELKNVFSGFISKIGTTDVCGQLEMCEEYSERLLKIRDGAYAESGPKIKVCGALSALFSLCALLML